MTIGKKASILFLICTASYLVLSMALSFFVAPSGDLLYLLNSLAVSVPSFFIPAMLFRRRENFPAFAAPKPLHLLLAIILGIGCVLLNESLTLFTSALFDGIRTVSNSTTTSSIAELSPVVMIIALVIIPPICEEFIMRGALLESWRRLSPMGAAALTSLIFGLLHTAPSSLLIYFGIGMVFALVYLITRNVWLTVTVHAVNNLIPVMLAIFSQQGDAHGAGIPLGSAAEGAVQSSGELLIMSIEFMLYAAMILVPILLLLRASAKKHGIGMYSGTKDSLIDGRSFPASGNESDQTIKLSGAAELFRDRCLWAILFVLIALNVISGLVEFGIIGADLK